MSFSNNQRGFTLVELMIGLFASAILTYAALSLYVTQNKHLIVQNEISDIQANVRSSAEVLASTIRMAGYNVPESLIPFETNNTNPDTILITFDTGMLVAVKLEYNMLQTTSSLRCEGHDLTRLTAGDSVYIFDPNTKTGEFFLATDVNYSTSSILHSTPLSKAYPESSKIIRINRIKFYIDQADSSHPRLMLKSLGSTPQVFADDIIDLNFRYFLANGAIVTQTSLPNDIRMVEIDVLGRSSSPDPDFAQNYRTRNFTLRVKVRNLGIG